MSPTDLTSLQTLMLVQYMFLWMSAQSTQKECIIGNVMNVFPSETTKQILEVNLCNSMLCNSLLKYTSIYIHTEGVSKMLRQTSKSFSHKNKQVHKKVCIERSGFGM